MEAKPILIYDLQACPVDAVLSFEQMTKIYKEHGIVIWDSTQYVDEPIEPKIFYDGEEVLELKMLDLANVDKADIKELIEQLNK